MRKTIINSAASLLMGMCLCSFNTIRNTKAPLTDDADMVVCGKVFTSEANELAEAFAVKDGKYIFVGSKADAQKYIGKDTKTINLDADNQMVMAGCTEGHGHYMQSKFIATGKSVVIFGEDYSKEDILKAIKERVAKGDVKYIYGFGYDYNKLNAEGFPTMDELDAIIADVPVYLADLEGHKGIVNRFCLNNSGILNKEGKVRDDFKYKGYVNVDEAGYPTGVLLEQAGTYVRQRTLVPDDDSKTWENCVIEAQKDLNRMGYTASFEGWTNMFGMDTFKKVSELDADNKLSVNWGLAYEIENTSTDEIREALAKAVDAKNSYTTKHVHANFVKLFIDGTLESGTGYVLTPNIYGDCGFPIWTDDELTNITREANSKGLTMHIHAMGDAGVKSVVRSFVNAYDPNLKMRNQIVHVRNVAPEDYDLMAKYGIVVSSGVLWHAFPPELIDEAVKLGLMARCYAEGGYPYQSFINHKIHTTVSTDAPATSGAPSDPFGIMEVAMTGTQTFGARNYDTPWNAAECAKNPADFLRSLTIEGAYQMGTEETRGSIAVGKYADFIIIDKDVLNCKATDLHNTKVLKTFFEGRCVYGEE